MQVDKPISVLWKIKVLFDWSFTKIPKFPVVKLSKHKLSISHIHIVYSEAENLDIAPLRQDEDSEDTLQTLDLNVVILPVDNRPPNILIGSAVFQCDEGGKHVLTSDHIWATDLDTSPEKLSEYTVNYNVLSGTHFYVFYHSAGYICPHIQAV